VRSSFAPFLVVASALAACAHTLNVPQPAMGGPGAPLPPLEASRLDVPLSADVRETLRALDAQVPSVIDTGGQFRNLGALPISVRYSVRRGPFRFEARDGVLHAESVLELSAEACPAAPLGLPIPFLSSGSGVCQALASCGVGESPRRVVIATNTSLRFDPSWRLVAETVPEAPRVIDPCALTPLRIDVSGFIAGLVAEQVAQATAQLDRDITERGDLRPTGERLWAGLVAPIDLGEGFWMSLDPEAVYAGPLVLDPAVVRASVGISARPHVVAGAPTQSAPRPLPPLLPREANAGRDGFRVTFDAAVGFDEVTRLVAQEFRGRTMSLEGHNVLVRDIHVSGSGAALLFLVDVRFEDGAFAGQSATVHLAGLPDYDAARGDLVVRDLDYTLETRSALVEFGEWFLRSGLRNDLAARARFPLGERIARLRTNAERALSRELAPGTRLEGHLSAVTPQGATVTAEGVTLRVAAEGTARVTQDVTSLGLTGR
jgi:Domain of unknown function (DUF4403)